jgi:predicted ATPase
MQGWVVVERGQVEEGLAQIQQGIADYQATGTALVLPDSLVLLAVVYMERNRTEEGLKVVAEALSKIDESGGRMWEPELYRLKGELTLMRESKEQGAGSREQEAEEYYLKAITIAQKQQAKSLELRAATSLARLWQRQGKRAEAHKLLSDVYNWFTEGFDTKDLQEAKALLESLESGV